MASISGELKQWHRVSVDFVGPTLSESAATFRDYRLDVTLTHQGTGETFVVPGFFAADGNAGETGATSGTIWRVHFNPPKVGEYTYTASFRTGTDVAASTNLGAGSATGFNGEAGNFSVAATDKTGDDFRAKGSLDYVGENYLQHAGTGEYFIKGGADSPENFLAFAGFDNTVGTHQYAPHVADWDTGDPTWQGGKGKGIIGAINYLSESGVNSQYFLTMNVGGDGKDVWPWTSQTARTTYDVSKLDQWEKVFSHMDANGVMMHVVTQETENDGLLDGGNLGVERAIYYRELIARFGHHNGVVWNLGEENVNTDAQRKSFSDFIKAVDPYDHLVVVHTHPTQQSAVYTPLLGHETFDGVSLQINSPRGEVVKWLNSSENAGRPWVVTWDEVGPANTGVMPDGATGSAANHTAIRGHLWGVLTAGGAGAEWYFGYNFPHNDLNLEDFRSRDSVWKWTDAATDFFAALPVTEMVMSDTLTTQTNDYVFAKPGEVYAIYLPTGGASNLNLSGYSGVFDVTWYDPILGTEHVGSVQSVNGGSTVSLGSAPYSGTQDWAILVTGDGDPNPGPGNGGGEMVYAINSGGPVFGDYSADSLFSGGKTYSTTAGISGTVDGTLYQSERYGNFGYALPVENGEYDVTLQFAELYWGAANKRKFDVTAEGNLIIDDLDIYAAAGGKNIAYDVTVPVTVTDGVLNLGFSTVLNNAKVGAIKVVSTDGGEPPPDPEPEPVTLNATGSILNGQPTQQFWNDFVALSALNWSNGPGVITHTADGFGISGGRFNNQIDHNPLTGGSEKLVIDFEGPVDDVSIRYGRLSPSENGQKETGAWTALDGFGNVVDTGVIDTAAGTFVSTWRYDIPIESDVPFSQLIIEATGYNFGTTPSSGDSSDFSILSMTYTPSDALIQ